MTGSTPLLPRYALGNWWSRYWPYTSDEYLDLIDRFETEKIPLSIGVLDMDWHITDIPARFGSGWTGYSWNRNLIPNPEQLLQQLHDRKLKLSLNVHPADGIRAYEEAYPQIAKRLGLNVELEEPAIFDFFNPSFREAYFKDVHYELEKQGVDFWWIDWQQGTQGMLDPLWLLNHYHYQDSCKNAEGGLILSRYAGPGSHRYPVGFSGDTIISWNSLRFQPYFTATASNIGYSWWSHDIGGHMLGDYDEELQTRWLQFGVFSPITRLHSSRSPFKGTNVSIIELPNKNDTAKFEWKDNKRTSLNDEVFRLLKTASLPYELKDRLLNQFINAKNSHDLMNILHHQDKELRGRLLEMIFTSQN